MNRTIDPGDIGAAAVEDRVCLVFKRERNGLLTRPMTVEEADQYIAMVRTMRDQAALCRAARQQKAEQG